MLDHFKRFAAYNSWANKHLYMNASSLSEEERHRDVGAFFKSLHGTLNHILVGDLLWMERLEGVGEKPATLDTILHDNFQDLKQHREETDRRLEKITSSLTEERLQSSLHYSTAAGIPCHDNISQILSHVFNHQTHHRGQCHHMLTQLGASPPPLDMIYLIRENNT